jgi:hypothetical protein
MGTKAANNNNVRVPADTHDSFIGFYCMSILQWANCIYVVVFVWRSFVKLVQRADRDMTKWENDLRNREKKTKKRAPLESPMFVEMLSA